MKGCALQFPICTSCARLRHNSPAPTCRATEEVGVQGAELLLQPVQPWDSGRLSPIARPGKQLLCLLLCQPSRPPRALAHGDGSRASLTLRNQRRGSWGAPFQHCAQHSGRTGWWGANGHRLGLPSWLPAQSCQPGAALLVLCKGTSHTARAGVGREDRGPGHFLQGSMPGVWICRVGRG